jgi:hypothetical protein
MSGRMQLIAMATVLAPDQQQSLTSHQIATADATFFGLTGHRPSRRIKQSQ